mgnify:CR=1 FL=1
MACMNTALDELEQLHSDREFKMKIMRHAAKHGLSEERLEQLALTLFVGKKGGYNGRHPN